MSKYLRFLAPIRQPISRPPSSLLRYNGQINVQRVRFLRPFFTRQRKNALIFGSSLIGTLLFKLIAFLPDDEKEQDDAKVTVKKNQVKFTSEKTKKEPDDWRQNTGRDETGGEGLGQENSRSGAQDRYEDGDEAEIDDEDEDKYEDEAENENVLGEDDVDEDDEDDDDDDGELEGGADEGEEGPVPEPIPEDAIFIPLGLIRQRRTSYYKGSDPEWQSFVEFSQDRKRSIDVRNELAGIVTYYTASMRGFQKALGLPINGRKFWLDIDFPDRPPPEYERHGLEITDDYIALTTRPVSSREYHRLRTILWPTSMASSLWASYRLLFSLRLARIKDYLNIRSEPETVNPNFSGSLFDFRRLANQKQESQPSPGLEGAPQAESGRPITAEATSKTLPKRALPNSTNVMPPMPSLPEPGKDMSIAMKMFKRTLAKTWKAAPTDPERGTFLVSGLIEVEGSKAVCVLDVRAAYHPRESRWSAVVVGVRRLQLKKQHPKGGI